MRQESSLDMYNKIPREFGFGRTKPTVKDVQNLLETMKAELIISSYSALLDASFNECIAHCARQKIAVPSFEANNFYFSQRSRRRELPTFDAWHFLLLLADYMKGRLTSSDVEQLLPYLWGNYVPKASDPRCLLQAFKTIDLMVVQYRQEMYAGKAENDKNNCITQSNVVTTEQTKQENAPEVESIIMKAESDAREIVETARRKSEKENRDILETAQQQADKIIQTASLIADRKIAEAQKRVLEFSAEKRLDIYKTERDSTEQCFSSVREALVKANENIKRLEDIVSESVTKKAYAQLIELYNLIADTKDSTFSLALENKSQDLENAAYNMDVFLEMLVEYLADYGVQTIASLPGDAFSAKHHALKKTGLQFDPRNARILRSLRNGFIWGEQVLQKERVEIEGDKNASWN